MEVRWRLFARDVLSLLPDDAGEFRFGRPLRPVRGLRLLGIVVHRARADTSMHSSSRQRGAAAAGSGSSGGKKRARGGSGCDGGGERASDDGAMDTEFGLLAIDDGTGVVEVRLPLRLWDTVALWEQLDIVGTPERLRGSVALSSKTAGVTGIRADGCHVEADPNVACLRALECIDRYKCCYFSRSWSPSGVPLPPLLPDPHAGDQPTGNANSRQGQGQGVGKGVGKDDDAGGWSGGHGQSEEGGTDGEAEAESGSSLEARLSGLIGSMGGATAAQLVAELGLPRGHGGVESALAQMQLEGAIYLAGDCYMPL